MVAGELEGIIMAIGMGMQEGIITVTTMVIVLVMQLEIAMRTAMCTITEKME